MFKRTAALLLAGLVFAACNGTPTSTAQTTAPGAASPAATSATGTQGAGEVDPNSIAGFCQAMTDTIVANMPPKDSAGAALISPLLRNFSNVAAFAPIKADLLAVADWTASASIMNPIPVASDDVLKAWANVIAFQGSNCA